MASAQEIERFRQAVKHKKPEHQVLEFLKPLEADDSEEVRLELVEALKHPSQLVQKKATNLLAKNMARDLGDESPDDEEEGDATLVVGVVPSPQLAAEVATESCLVVIHGAELGKKIEIGPQNTLTIGRGRKCDIPIDQDAVSRRHAQLVSDSQGIMVRDLGSTNGTFLNDTPVEKPQLLRDGDLLNIGRTIFKFFQSGNIEQAYHQEIYRLTTVDGLTQVYNKRYLMETMEREIARSHRYGSPLGLMMFDIDHFKRVNDTYGHLAGDHVLRELSCEVHESIRQSDIMGRYGGEEFAILLPSTEAKDSMAFAEKIRQRVDGHRFSFDDDIIPVTISSGVAQLDATIKSPERLIKAADERLYEAKRTGRNRSVGPTL